jgi:hypothetical protein
VRAGGTSVGESAVHIGVGVTVVAAAGEALGPSDEMSPVNNKAVVTAAARRAERVGRHIVVRRRRSGHLENLGIYSVPFDTRGHQQRSQ